MLETLDEKFYENMAFPKLKEIKRTEIKRDEKFIHYKIYEVNSETGKENYYDLSIKR